MGKALNLSASQWLHLRDAVRIKQVDICHPFSATLAPRTCWAPTVPSVTNLQTPHFSPTASQTHVWELVHAPTAWSICSVDSFSFFTSLFGRHDWQHMGTPSSTILEWVRCPTFVLRWHLHFPYHVLYSPFPSQCLPLDWKLHMFRDFM